MHHLLALTPKAASKLPTLAGRWRGTSMSTWNPPALVWWIDTSQRQGNEVGALVK